MERMDVVLVVDVANVMGSRPDGWWRDRAAAATRLVSEIATLAGARVPGPDGGEVKVTRLVAVVEGQARGIEAPIGTEGVEVIDAPTDGDTAIVNLAAQIAGASGVPLVVTADRGLRARLPESAVISGPGWLLEQSRRA